jgi:hypothetical protein
LPFNQALPKAAALRDHLTGVHVPSAMTAATPDVTPVCRTLLAAASSFKTIQERAWDIEQRADAAAADALDVLAAVRSALNDVTIAHAHALSSAGALPATSLSPPSTLVVAIDAMAAALKTAVACTTIADASAAVASLQRSRSDLRQSIASAMSTLSDGDGGSRGGSVYDALCGARAWRTVVATAAREARAVVDWSEALCAAAMLRCALMQPALLECAVNTGVPGAARGVVDEAGDALQAACEVAAVVLGDGAGAAPRRRSSLASSASSASPSGRRSALPASVRDMCSGAQLIASVRRQLAAGSVSAALASIAEQATPCPSFPRVEAVVAVCRAAVRALAVLPGCVTRWANRAVP